MKRFRLWLRENIFDYTHRKTFWEAVVIYVIHTATILLVGLLAGLVVGIATGKTDDRALGRQIGAAIMMFFSVVIPFFMIAQKKLWHIRYVLVMIFAVVLTYLEGIIVGLLPALYLSLIDGKNEVPVQ